MHTRQTLTAAVVGISAIATAHGAGAATITWSTAPVSGYSDVSTAGTFISSLDENPNGPLTINTVTFSDGTFSSPSSNTSGYYSADGTNTAPIVVSGEFDPSGKDNYYTGGAPTSDTNYNALLSYLGFENSGTLLTTSLNGLTTGAMYQVQMFVYQVNGGGNGATITSGPTLTASGDVATGTFVADGSSQTFSFTGPNGAAGIFDAFQLRETPEPTSLGLVTTAASGLLLRRRKNHRSHF